MAVLSYLEIVLAANSASFNQSIADARSQTKVAFSDMREYANKMGPAVGAAIGAASVATTALVVEQVALANELQKTANVANSSIKEIQKYTVGAKKMGIEQDALGAIFQDTSDKIGDFLSTGGGGMADFFENIAPKIGVTAEEFRNLSGPQALQLYYDSLEKAKIGQNEMTFYMEAMASDATTLIPLLANGGEGFDVWAKAAANAGAVMDDETIVATQKLQATTDLLELSVDGAKTQFVKGFIPVLADVATKLTGTESASDAAYLAGQNLAIGFKGVAKVGIGVTAVFDAVGSSIGGVAAIIGTLFKDVGIADSGLEIARKIGKNLKAAGEINRMVDQDIRDSLSSYADLLSGVDELGSGVGNATVDALIEQKKRLAELNEELAKTGKEEQEQQEAAKKAAEDKAKSDKAALEAAKKLGAVQAVNSKVLAQAKQFNYGGLEQQYGLPAGLLSAVSMQESRGNANARSPVGASGAFQFMPGTAKRFDIGGQEADIAKSAEAAAKYLSFLMNKFGSVDLALAGYNAGEGNVAKYGNKIPPFKETQSYVKKVNAYLAFMKGGLDGSVNIAGNISAQTAIIEREAAEQARILEQQAKDRISIRLEYADEATRIEEQLKTNILKISASGFSDNERDAFIADAIDVANAKLAQIQLVHDQQMQYAQQSEQTDAERIRNQYALERREIQLTVNMDEQLRKAKIDALNQAEQMALDERRYAYESELRQLTSIGQSDLAALRQSYADQRRALDQRTDIDPSQKSDLRNAMAGAQIYETNQLQEAPRDAFNAQQAQLGGYSQQYGLDQQYKQQLEVIENAKKAELLTVETYEQAKFAVQQEYQQSTQSMMLAAAGEQFGSVTEVMRMAFGEQNGLYQAAFIFQKGLAIGQALLNIPESYSNAFNAVVGIPIVGPVLAPAAGAAAAALQVAQKVMIDKVQPPSMPGFEVGGYTGTGGTSDVAGLVHYEEFVANAPTTKQFRPELEAMHNGTYESKYRNQGININITNNAPVDISTSVNDDGSIDMRIDKRMNERVPQIMAQQINTAASPVRNALTNNFNLERRF